MNGPDVGWYLIVAAILFGVGALGVMMRRSPLIVLLSLEIMLNAANLTLIAFARQRGDLDGQIFALSVMAVAAAEVAIGLGLIVAMARRRIVLDVDQGASKLGVQLGRIENNGGGKDPAAALARELTIVDLVEGSGLARAGLEIGDVVVGLDGKTLSDYKGFHELVAKLTPGSMVRVVFRRGGETKEVDARVDLHHPMQ